MVMQKEDLGLSLSLSLSTSLTATGHAEQLNPILSSSSSPPHFVLQKAPWSSVFASSERSCETYSGETRPFLIGIDVNRTPSTADCDDEAGGIYSPNSTVSSVSGKRSEREDIEMDRACYRGFSDEEDGGEASRKKLRLSKEQSAILEESFKEHNTLNPKQKIALAKQLNLRPRQVEVWFQNRRARTKLKQTEVDCELLKRCCESLTEENRRLQKEVQELRALKLSPHLYMHMTPPTTLILCPSCERVGVSSSASSDATVQRHHVPAPILRGALLPH